MNKTRTLKPVNEMAEAMRAEVDNSPQRKKLYPSTGGTESQQARQESLRRNITRLNQSIRRNREAVDLFDTEAVRARVSEYLEACTEAAVFPTALGMCTHGLAMSRQNMYAWRHRHPDHSTTQFLSMIEDSFADLLASASLSGDAVAVPAIFTLKNCHGWADRYQFEPITEEHVETEFSAEDIAKRYLADSGNAGLLASSDYT